MKKVGGHEVSMQLYLGRRKEAELIKEESGWEMLSSRIPDPSVDLEEHSNTSVTLEKISKILNERELRVMILLHRDGLTLEEVGETEGITHERVRQIQEKAREKVARRKNWFG